MNETTKRNFQMLFAYQKKEIELRKIYDAIKRDPELVNKNRYEHDFGEAKQVLEDCSKQANSLLNSYSDLQRNIADNEAALAALEQSDAESEEELSARVKKLEGLKNKFQSAEKKASDFERNSKAVCNRRAEAVKAGKEAQAKYKTSKDKYGELLKAKTPEVNKLKAELAAMREKLDPTLFAEYQKLVDSGKFPAVVPARTADKKNMFNCGGCGLGLPQSGNATLIKDGYFRCENCHRIVVWID